MVYHQLYTVWYNFWFGIQNVQLAASQLNYTYTTEYTVSVYVWVDEPKDFSIFSKKTKDWQNTYIQFMLITKHTQEKLSKVNTTHKDLQQGKSQIAQLAIPFWQTFTYLILWTVDCNSCIITTNVLKISIRFKKKLDCE